MKKVKIFNLPCRVMAVLLCLCMITSMLFGDISATTASAAVIPGPTQNILDGSRVADPNTMDDYQYRLLTEENGSRYAGRVWTDKTVFAYGASDANGGVTGNAILLDMETDGYTGNVGFNSDFLHVYSALASSQVVNEYPPSPIDLVIVFDMSGSMGQDTRYEIDSGVNTYVEHTSTSDGFPTATGVSMAERIENSRVQKTLDAINETIDGLMKQNPQNRVAVCGYGANATVLLPLAHYRHKDGSTPYLSVGGMETLYHPSDLRYDDKSGWMWMNNRDTCYTVVVNAGNEMNTYTGPLSDGKEAEGNEWTDVSERTVSNNALDSDGNPVKAFPGAWEDDGKTPLNTFSEQSQKVYDGAKSGDSRFSNGVAAQEEGGLVKTIENTRALKADDYVGYFTNTQGGIYLAYKQLADSEDTTYSETLTNGVMSTVARIPAAIIMSDGGANFAFNEMGPNDGSKYSVNDWNSRYGQKYPVDEGENRDSWGVPSDPNHRYMNDDSYGKSESSIKGHDKDYLHRLGSVTESRCNTGDEWYKVYLPGNDTLDDGGWNGLHGICNIGADYYKDGTLTTQPEWNHAGVLYSSDSDVLGTSGTVLQVLLTASYMNTVVEKHYETGWEKNKATKESRIPLSNYTMNVDTQHVPQWGKMRLYPTLDPKEYPLDTILSDRWYNKTDKFGPKIDLYSGQVTLDTIYEGLANSWTSWKSNGTTKAMMKGGTIQIAIDSIKKNSEKGSTAEYISGGGGDNRGYR